jgi:hypothetical protein
VISNSDCWLTKMTLVFFKLIPVRRGGTMRRDSFKGGKERRRREFVAKELKLKNEAGCNKVIKIEM